jgi:hypothetical protein
MAAICLPPTHSISHWPSQPLFQTAVFSNWPRFTQDGYWFLAAPSGGKDPKPPYIQIQSDHWTFLTRGIEAPYLDWRQVMPSPDREITTVKLAEELLR